MKRLAVIVVVLVGAVAVRVWSDRSSDAPVVPPPDAVWSGLDAQARCESAQALVTHPQRWPTVCRWRNPGEALQAQAFPPPKGPPPYDDPHVEIYVAAHQSREDLARTIAHEWGHMHHTREPGFVAEWLAARNLPDETPWEVWAEDYAEVFAALFSPPAPGWRAPTNRPSPEALALLKERFFA